MKCTGSPLDRSLIIFQNCIPLQGIDLASSTSSPNPSLRISVTDLSISSFKASIYCLESVVSINIVYLFKI